MYTINLKKKRLLGIGIIISIILFSISAILVQLDNESAKIAKLRSISKESANAFRSLKTSDGLFNFPELQDANTLESRIDATFLVSEMARETIYPVASENTGNSLYSYAKNQNNPVALRLKAYYALRNFKDQRWKEGLTLAREVNSTFPSSVTENNVAKYISLAEPLALLDDSFKPKTKLIPFDPTVNEQSERLAVSLIILNYLFTNSGEIRGYFNTLQPKLCDWASGNAQYVQQTLFAANALIGTTDNVCINYDHLRSLYGCTQSSQFVSIDGNAATGCSLTLTYYANKLGVPK